MSPIDIINYWLATATNPGAEDLFAQDVISLFITAIISASVFAALVTGTIQYLINRKNSKITEKKNTVDAESDLIARYKEAAAEERLQKESAVQTIKNLLQFTEGQVDSLKNTVETLNKTITSMSLISNTQSDLIDQLTVERDRNQAALEKAEMEIARQKSELLTKQEAIRKLTDEIKKLEQ